MQTLSVTVPNGFVPRAYQRAAMRYFDKGGRRAITVWHRRGGKDLTALHQTCKMMHRRLGAYWHIFPTAEQGRKAIWEGFTKDGQRTLEQVFPRAIRRSPERFTPNGDMIVELRNGSIWRLLGSDRMEVVGAGPVGVVFSEFALAKPNTWDLIRPMLRENDGWAWMITTPRGKNHAYKLFRMAQGNPRWFSDLKSLTETRAYDPEATLQEERESGMPEELIAQEYLCDFSAANVGSFYGAHLAALEKRGLLAPFNAEGGPVDTAWDLGKADDTAIWWWTVRADGGVDVLDHYAAHGHELGHYFDVLRSRAEKYGWRYRRHWLPHDARAKTLATKVSVFDQAREALGSNSVSIAPQLTVKDGIAAARRLLGKRTRMHPRCSDVSTPRDCDGIEALRAYHREWDAEGRCFGETPVHDWASHTADAFRYLALVAEVTADLSRQPEAPKPPARVLPEAPTVEDIFRSHLEAFEESQ